ncbi:MAG: tetratricopeptide repeat protein [Buchnera aphidicola (Periphyllus lyropictus)]|uniref:transglutaminase family protein n=1 Tax=Buchnera aphidicola TaxID=9 RepID=UPI001EBC1A24|nr:tetratricopeptide repeat protein [Buchnera aphidicola]NIH16673.1 tetratricopeptide repeat protein [Buchnera aphidicola (Periphyllus lyropictus)]USS94580.1 tetratricopeptide repeat protein [Buchnera aphidicola (Periphyllus lyropictus)]
MKCFYNIDFSKTTILEVIISCLKKIKKNFPKKSILFNLKSKLKEIRKEINFEKDMKNKLKKLLKFFYYKWKFREMDGKYNITDSLWLDKVIESKKGISFSLGIILLFFSKKLKIPLKLVVFPTQIILKIKISNKKVLFIDPNNGNFLSIRLLSLWLKGNFNSSALLYDKYLKKANYQDVLKKFLNSLKSSLMEEKKVELALKVSNILLKISPKDPYEIRDRGLIYAQLKCYNVAIKDLSYFIKNCPNDPISDIIKLKIESISKEFHIFH